MKNALIVGIDSSLGKALEKELFAAGWSVFGTTRRKVHVKDNVVYLDLVNAKVLDFEQPVDVVFLCASITKIASCRDNVGYSKLINCDAQIMLTNYFLNRASHVVFLSTSDVFDGQEPSYRINDKVNPITVYGIHKAMVEEKLQEMDGKITIVRLSKILTKEHPLLVGWLQQLHQKNLIAPFHDLPLCPISMDVVTYCLKEIAERKLVGIIHLSGEKDVTYLDVATYLANAMNVDQALIQSKSIVGSDMPLAEVPRFASLDISESESLLSYNNVSLAITLNSLYGDYWCKYIPNGI